MSIQAIAAAIQKYNAPDQPKLSTKKPVPIPDKIAPRYPNNPQKPVAAEATFFEPDSTAHIPPTNICGPAVKKPIPPMQR